MRRSCFCAGREILQILVGEAIHDAARLHLNWTLIDRRLEQQHNRAFQQTVERLGRELPVAVRLLDTRLERRVEAGGPR